MSYEITNVDEKSKLIEKAGVPFFMIYSFDPALGVQPGAFILTSESGDVVETLSMVGLGPWHEEKPEEQIENINLVLKELSYPFVCTEKKEGSTDSDSDSSTSSFQSTTRKLLRSLVDREHPNHASEEELIKFFKENLGYVEKAKARNEFSELLEVTRKRLSESMDPFMKDLLGIDDERILTHRQNSILDVKILPQGHFEFVGAGDNSPVSIKTSSLCAFNELLPLFERILGRENSSDLNAFQSLRQIQTIDLIVHGVKTLDVYEDYLDVLNHITVDQDEDTVYFNVAGSILTIGFHLGYNRISFKWDDNMVSTSYEGTYAAVANIGTKAKELNRFFTPELHYFLAKFSGTLQNW